MGMGEPSVMCEIETYPRAILAKRYPSARIHDDINTVSVSNIGPVQAVIGGFPCQDISNANPEGKGLGGSRSGLWFEMLRLIRETRCDYVVAENVASLQRKGLNAVSAGLESAGYYVEATRIAASDVGHPHRRHRLLILAYRAGMGTLASRDEFGGNWTRIRGDWKGVVPRYLGDGLGTAVRKWSTPLASDTGRANKFAQGGTPLSVQVRQWPTPTATDYKGSTGPGLRRGSTPEAVGVETGAFGPLNPDWVEALMGWPVGWTDTDCDDPLEIPGSVMGRGLAQHQWEPPRMVKAREVKSRTARIKACGNGVVEGLGAIAKARADAVISGRVGPAAQRSLWES